MPKLCAHACLLASTKDNIYAANTSSNDVVVT